MRAVLIRFVANRVIGACLAALCLSVSLPGAAQGELNVVSWDGAYVRSQMLGYILRYEKETGTRINVLQYSGGIEEIREQVRAWNVHWDVVDLELFDAIRACQEGLLVEIDPATLPPAPDGTPADEDFMEHSLMRCGVGNMVSSTVVSYDSERIDSPPEGLRDFFDLDEYPGRRGLRRSPQGNLEWALVADGVPRDKVYETLSTEQGLDRAFEVLTRIKPFVEWWRTGQEAIRLLETDQVVMSSVYSGRVPSAVDRGVPLEILWDHQIWMYDVWGIPKHGRNIERARDFVRYASTTTSLARQASYIPYGPVRRSSMQQLAPETRRNLPTTEQRMETAIELNARWWSENLEPIQRRFERWLERPVMVPRDLPRR